MSQPILKIALDNDQKGVLIGYSLYTNQVKHKYLQYTAACALIFSLNIKGIFSYNPKELLVCDYLGSRKYIYKAKLRTMMTKNRQSLILTLLLLTLISVAGIAEVIGFSLIKTIIVIMALTPFVILGLGHLLAIERVLISK